MRFNVVVDQFLRSTIMFNGFLSNLKFYHLYFYRPFIVFHSNLGVINTSIHRLHGFHKQLGPGQIREYFFSSMHCNSVKPLWAASFFKNVWYTKTFSIALHIFLAVEASLTCSKCSWESDRPILLKLYYLLWSIPCSLINMWSIFCNLLLKVRKGHTWILFCFHVWTFDLERLSIFIKATVLFILPRETRRRQKTCIELFTHVQVWMKPADGFRKPVWVPKPGNR